MLRTVNPKDCKNLMFDGLSSFLMMQLERVLLSGDVTDHVKNSLSLCVRSVQYEHLKLALSLWLSHMSTSDGDFLSENRAIIRSDR